MDTGQGRSLEPRPPERAAGSATAVRRAAEALRLVVPAVRSASRFLLRLATAALLGGAAVWWYLAGRNGGGAPALAVWALLLLAAPAMLAAEGYALRELARLPERLARLPERARDRAAELGRLAGEARRVRERGRLRSVWSLVRLWRRAAGSRELLDLAAPLALLLSPWAIAGTLLALVASVVEVGAGLVALLLLLR